MFVFITENIVIKTINVTVRFMSQNVFVYGTLKQNEPNHHWLTKKENGVSKFLGYGKTTRKYPLIIATPYNIPFLLYSPDNGHFVQGDVYEVDDEMIKNLDVLEDHPNFYIREIDDIEMVDSSNNKKLVKCWVYFIKTFKPSLLKLPTMESYSSTGPHGKPYAERSSRDPKRPASSFIWPEK